MVACGRTQDDEAEQQHRGCCEQRSERVRARAGTVCAPLASGERRQHLEEAVRCPISTFRSVHRANRETSCVGGVGARFDKTNNRGPSRRLRQ
eukprot:2050349-Prymnesium_polylepis.3